MSNDVRTTGPDKRLPQERPPSQPARQGTQQPRQQRPASVKPDQDGYTVVQHKNGFYKEGVKKLYIAAVVTVVGILIQSIIAFFGFTAKNERVYIATDKNGSLITLTPLGQPNQKNEVVAQWMQNALVDTFSFNFTNLQTRLNETTMKWFTANGANQFLKEMRDSGHFEVVQEGRMILSLTLDSTPILVSYGPGEADKYTWILQADAVLTFRTQSKEYSKKVRFTVNVERRSILENADGLGISKIVMTNR
jgi:intracellular multiplication protein IcmL